MSTTGNKRLIEELAISLKTENTGANRKKWANYLLTQPIELNELLVLLQEERAIALRFTWLMGDLCEIAPVFVYPSIVYLFSKRHQIQVLNFNRSLAKMFYLCGVPQEIAGEAVDEMFKWLLDAKVDVTIKNYSLLALYQLASKHKDLKNELKIVLTDQLDKNPVSFEKKAQQILKQLENER